MQFDHLATYSDTTRPGITRLVFTERDMEAREYIKGLMKEAGLTVREDIMGNTFGRWKGSDPTAGIKFPLQHNMPVWKVCIPDAACQAGPSEIFPWHT